MRNEFKIFVEGPADKRFIEQLICHLWQFEVPGDSIISTDGYTNLMSDDKGMAYANQMRRTSDEGGINLVIFDADADCETRRRELLEWKGRAGVDFELFLLPDNAGSGALEDLLERIVNPDNKAVIDCWNGYEESLRGIVLPWRNGNPLTIPAKKTKIYAYLEVLLGVSKSEKKKIKESNRIYTDKNHWDLDAAALSGLSSFLKANLD